MGDSYHLYLHDTPILQQKHVNALNKESKEVLKLLLTLLTVPGDTEMGVY